MQSFADLVTDNPSAITQVVISDLHLSMNEPATNPLGQAFLDFLDKLALLPNLKQFFILGDWFEAWLGDDVADTDTLTDALQPIIAKLKTLSDKNCQIFVMHGNRDFLLGQQFCDKFGGQLIFEPFYLKLNGRKVRLEHGDALCTDDVAYQRFKKIIRNPVLIFILRRTPLSFRKKLADGFRQKSHESKQEKHYDIMDVNQQAVDAALKDVDVLIHGHTHRPMIHTEMNHKQLGQFPIPIYDCQLLSLSHIPL